MSQITIRLCKCCSHYEAMKPANGSGPAQGKCRAHPPMPHVMQQTLVDTITGKKATNFLPVTAWPVVNANDFCGEFVMKPREADAIPLHTEQSKTN